MSVCYETFLQWSIDRFGEENIKLKKGGREICTHSIFTVQFGLDQDLGFHLWMNPDGGKKELEHGGYRCWKTNAMGSLVSLVADIDHIPFDEAEEFLCGSLSLRSLECKVEQFFKNLGYEPLEVVPPPSGVELPPHSAMISKLPKGSYFRAMAEKYLTKRKQPIDGLYYCFDGKYKNRVVIPYYDQEGKLIWYNARTLSDSKKILRYMKPEGEGLSQDNVLYFPDWPHVGSKVYITEGEFDARVLRLSGFYSCACGGAHLSASQLQILRGYYPVMAFDNDEDKVKDAGKEATLNIGEALLTEGFQPRYVRPPVGYKDWNALLEKRDFDTIRSYIERYEKPFTTDTADILRMK